MTSIFHVPLLLVWLPPLMPRYLIDEFLLSRQRIHCLLYLSMVGTKVQFCQVSIIPNSCTKSWIITSVTWFKSTNIIGMTYKQIRTLNVVCLNSTQHVLAVVVHSIFLYSTFNSLTQEWWEWYPVKKIEAATTPGPLPIERASKIDLVTILAVYQH